MSSPLDADPGQDLIDDYVADKWVEALKSEILSKYPQETEQHLDTVMESLTDEQQVVVAMHILCALSLGVRVGESRSGDT